MLMVSSQFKFAAAAGSWAASGWNSSAARIFIYKGTKPTNLQATPFVIATYSANLLITYTLATSTFTNTGSVVHFNITPANATASASGTAAWAAVCNASTGTPSNVAVGDVTLSSGNGMVFLPTLTIVSGTSYSILECSWTIV